MTEEKEDYTVTYIFLGVAGGIMLLVGIITLIWG